MVTNEKSSWCWLLKWLSEVFCTLCDENGSLIVWLDSLLAFGLDLVLEWNTKPSFPYPDDMVDSSTLRYNTQMDVIPFLAATKNDFKKTVKSANDQQLE